MKKLTKHEIIDYIVDYYKTRPRAIYEASCLYKTPQGHMCAHSICLTVKARNAAKELNGYGARALINAYGDSIHKAKFRGHHPQFWVEMQFLHDQNYYWIKRGTGNILTQKGESYVTDLKARYW